MKTLDPPDVAEPFTADVRHESDRTVIALRGEIDMAVAPCLRSLLDEQVAAGHVRLVLDLAGLEFIDSSGLSVFICAMRAAQAGGGELRLRAPRPNTRRVLETTRLNEVIPVDL